MNHCSSFISSARYLAALSKPGVSVKVLSTEEFIDAVAAEIHTA